MKGENSARLSTLDRLCDAMLVEPSALVREGIATNVLMSRRVTRILDAYSSLDHDQREIAEKFIETLAKIKSGKDKVKRQGMFDFMEQLVLKAENAAA
jgi:hypothetical protein